MGQCSQIGAGMGFYLMFDVGGTKIKAGILGEDGKLLDNHIYSYPSKAKEPKDAIFLNFKNIILELIHSMGQSDREIKGIGMAFPGPFDYEKGMSRMVGLDKYDSIANLSIQDELGKICEKVKTCKFKFLHDVEGFALGVCRGQQTKPEEKKIHLCIGTGAGSAFTKGQEVLKETKEGVPENGWIYSYKFKEGIIDDYLSVRGLRNLANLYCGQPLDGEKLFQMAEMGEESARKVFKHFGKDLADAMKGFLDDFAPAGLVLGGQISKSFSYFGEDIKRYCQSMGVEIYLEEDTSKRIMEGLFTLY